MFCGFCGGTPTPASTDSATQWLDYPHSGAVTLGPYRFVATGPGEQIEGETPSEVPSTGEIMAYEVHGPRALHLEVGEVTWHTGECEIRVARRFADSPTEYDCLVNRLRMPVKPDGSGRRMVVLKQARLNGQPRPTLCSATALELSRGAGLPVLDLLAHRFSAQWGTLAELCQETSRARFLLGATFPSEMTVGPIAAFLLTRIAPTVRRYATEAHITSGSAR
jgi:hypothetical protein